ncbi:PRLD1 protein, partial [Nesospiza acunhae]|nr:PRLD1 protein [Nesospiza acunhae]
MGKYCASLGVLKGPWDQVFAAFWQRYPNPYSKHVLTEDIVHREVTPDHKLLSRRLLTKTNRMPRWAERFFPANVAHSVYILEDSIVDPKNRTMTTFTWNINHARLMVGVGLGGCLGGGGDPAVPTAGLCLLQVVEERCEYRVNPENSNWTEVKREAWVSSSLFGVSRAIQEFGLARFKSNVTKSTKGFEYVLAKMQGEAPSKTLVETAKEATEKAKETALAATEKAKDLASKAATKKKQYV